MSKLILHSIYDVQMSPLKGKSTRKVAIANGTCVSFCNQPKAHFGLPWPGYAPGTIAVNVTWMERGFNAGQRHGSIYPSIFNRLRAIEILVGNYNCFLPLAFNASVGGVLNPIPLEFRENVWSSEN